VRVCFRADASLEIGSGHVVRCANLARRLAADGHEVTFVCRRLRGDLADWLTDEGFELKTLPFDPGQAVAEPADAEATAAAIGQADWLIVDHYALGNAWEQIVSVSTKQLMAIDDLGRRHACDLLLDQNYNSPAHAHYPTAGPSECTLLLGPQYALLHPDFAALRDHSLAKRRNSPSRLLVFMSGSDAGNETCKALEGIRRSRLRQAHVDVAIGANNPHRQAVERACAALQSATLHIQTARMAPLMAEADLALGGAGSATWERCALGLPALVTVLADNQVHVAQAVERAGALRVLGRSAELTAGDYARVLDAIDAAGLTAMSAAAATICDCKGAERVSGKLMQLSAAPVHAHTTSYA